MKMMCTLLLFVAVGDCLAATNALTPAAISNEIRTVIMDVGTNVSFSVDPAPVCGLLEMSAKFSALATNMGVNWRTALDSFHDVAPENNSRMVLLHSLLFLPPEDYAECLNHVLDLYKTGEITRDEFVHVFLVPPRSENQYFLSYNHKHPTVNKFLLNCRNAFSNDTVLCKLLDWTLSGEARKRDEYLQKKDKRDPSKIPLLQNK